jgi:hypothetical protein
MTSPQDAEREAFEAAMRPRDPRRDENGCYYYAGMEEMWIGFQAGRASLSSQQEPQYIGAPEGPNGEYYDYQKRTPAAPPAPLSLTDEQIKALAVKHFNINWVDLPPGIVQFSRANLTGAALDWAVTR